MLKLDPCPKSGRVYIRLTKAEVDAIGDIVFTGMKLNPRDPASQYPDVKGYVAYHHIEMLLTDDDLTEDELKAILYFAKNEGIAVPPALSSPGTTYERFRGVYSNDDYHWLRRYKYSIWLQASAIKHGINLEHELGICSYRYFTYRPEGSANDVNVPWFRIAKEPQIPEMAEVVAMNRNTERSKRSGSRVRERGIKLKRAGWEARGYAGWFQSVPPKSAYTPKDED